MEDKKTQLEGKLSAAKTIGDERLIKQYETELAGLATVTAEVPVAPGAFVIPGVTMDDYERAVSKFAEAGTHLSEFGMPYMHGGTSFKFPFTIIEDGPDKGKENEIAAGISRQALWKLREILSTLGVPMQTAPGGAISFDPAQVYGKRALTLWTKQKDSRSVEEGGKGTEYTKPVSVLPVGTEPPADLGI